MRRPRMGFSQRLPRCATEPTLVGEPSARAHIHRDRFFPSGAGRKRRRHREDLVWVGQGLFRSRPFGDLHFTKLAGTIAEGDG